MKKKSKQIYKINIAKSPDDLAEMLGIESDVEVALMKYKAELSAIATNSIKSSGLTLNEIVKISGVARSKVSAIKNGALSGISFDLFMKIIAATGAKLQLKIAA